MKVFQVRGERVTGEGFALVSIVSLAALLALLALAISSLGTREARGAHRDVHRDLARANARLGFMMALGELQRYTGPDQRVTARAAILEQEVSGDVMPNRNWLGVWKTTHSTHDGEWPLIGKASGGQTQSPYSRPGAYQDLRHIEPALMNGSWRRDHVQTWLVSKSGSWVDPGVALDARNAAVVELVGRGTLGQRMLPEVFEQQRVLVPKVALEAGDQKGAYAWYISDNNQKASIVPCARESDPRIALEAAPASNPALVEKADGSRPYRDFSDAARPHAGKIASYASAALSQTDPEASAEKLREEFHHFTTYSPGLFTNTLMSGLRKDLTPLLFGEKDSPGVTFSLDQAGAPLVFSSAYPLIPGPEHGVLGPSFAAMRSWAKHKYTGLQYAETYFAPGAKRMRPKEHWSHGISDGACPDATNWAAGAPKIHPVMTECRWHYYFSHQNKQIRTHIIPRVCLWNPYNRTLKTGALSVLMPNPYFGVRHGMHFFPEKDHVEQDLKRTNIKAYDDWVAKGGYVGGDVYKIRLNPFPQRRFLAFTLEASTLAAGECQVFSPKVNGGLSAGGVTIQPYRLDAVSENTLSPSSMQGGDHFYFDHDPSVAYQIQAPGWKTINSHLEYLDFSRIFDYQPALDLQGEGKVEHFPFVLKVGAANDLAELYESMAHPTLQLINNGAGGVKATKTFHYMGLYWGSANQKDRSFGFLQTFAGAPAKNPPSTHHVGSKLLWLDESVGEANPFNRSPHRYGTSSMSRWSDDHMVYHVCPVANWNVRAQLVSRSPVSQCANKWYMNSTGPWLMQFVPYRPMDVSDMPTPSRDVFVKNPFGLAVDFSAFPNVVLFDFPSEDYGVLSLAGLRHAMLSPYSWSPSYLVGHSLRDMHAPASASAHEAAVSDAAGLQTPTRWDYLLGQAEGDGPGHGARCVAADSQGLLQIGNEQVVREIAEYKHSSREEVLAYDIAYEVNHNLWDAFFLSGMPLSSSAGHFTWNPDEGVELWNPGYEFNRDATTTPSEAVTMLSAPEGLNTGFWRNAEFLRNRAAFNINSTSVEAWTAFLSSTLGIKRPLADGELDATHVSFARYRRPVAAAKTDGAAPDRSGGWAGARQLNEEEVRLLAKNIVSEVKRRGPFVSVADFVNRRLVSVEAPESRMGVIDAAIEMSGLNRNFERSHSDLSTSVNSPLSTDAPDNNMPGLRESYRYLENGQWVTAQPKSKAWGMPGFLTQGDVLEPLAASLSARGDTFTIRAYGESSEAGEIKARAWLEAIVERTPNYMEHREAGEHKAGANSPTDAELRVDYATGVYRRGLLTPLNSQHGRRYRVKGIRWLRPEEI